MEYIIILILKYTFEIINNKMIGDIYKVTCKTSGKCYVGQAKKHFGRDDDKWGYIKRWKSHIYEDTSIFSYSPLYFFFSSFR